MPASTNADPLQNSGPLARRSDGLGDLSDRWLSVHKQTDTTTDIGKGQTEKDQHRRSTVGHSPIAAEFDYATLDRAHDARQRRVLSLQSLRHPASASASSTSSSTLHPKPTARPSASSRQVCANGPTSALTKPHKTSGERIPSYHAGSAVQLAQTSWQYPKTAIITGLTENNLLSLTDGARCNSLPSLLRMNNYVAIAPSFGENI
jgi:hypothetical protein